MKTNRRLYMKLLSAVILWAAIWPLGAGADCQWEWLCDESGLTCHRGAVCDSVHDVLPPAPAERRPVVGPSVKPLAKTGAAPEGASNCGQIRRCDGQGNCNWDILCECI